MSPDDRFTPSRPLDELATDAIARGRAIRRRHTVLRRSAGAGVATVLVAAMAIVSLRGDAASTEVRTADDRTVDRPAPIDGSPGPGSTGDVGAGSPTTLGGADTRGGTTDSPTTTVVEASGTVARRAADSSVAFVGDVGGVAQILVAKGDGSALRQLTTATTGSMWPTWAPAGDRVAFYRAPGGVNQLYVVSTAGGDERLVTSLGGDHATQPAWSPTGEEIAFTRFSRPVAQAGVGPTTPMGIWVVRSDGSGLRQLTPDGAQPAWSPDGRRLAYVDASGLHVLDLESGRSTALAPGANVPSWSPDGARIAFGRVVDEREQLFVIDADGSGERAVLESEAHDSQPAWTPDGRALVFTRDVDGRVGSVRCSLESCGAGGATPSSLWLVAVDGGEPTELFPSGGRGDRDASFAP